MPTLAETILVQVQLLGQRRNYLRTKREKATTASASGIQTQTNKSNHRKCDWDPDPNNQKQPPQKLSGIQTHDSCKTPRWKNKTKETEQKHAQNKATAPAAPKPQPVSAISPSSIKTTNNLRHIVIIEPCRPRRSRSATSAQRDQSKASQVISTSYQFCSPPP